MIDFVIHDSTGRITEFGAVIESILHMQVDPGRDQTLVVGKGNMDRHWVKDGQIVERPNMGFALSALTVPANGNDAIILSGVPKGAALEIVGPVSAAGQSTGEDITLTFALPGRYFIRIEQFPYLNVEEIVHAV